MHEFEELELAVMARLEALKLQGLKTLEPYVNQLEAEDLESLESGAVHWPAVFVVANGLEVTVVQRADLGQMGISLFVCDRNVRGSRFAVKGDTQSPGIYALLKNIRERLHRQVILPGWTALELQRETPFVWYAKKQICIFLAQYGLKTAGRV